MNKRWLGLIVAMAFFLGLLAGGLFSSPGRASATADNLVYVAVDIDGDGANDYELTIGEVVSQFETPEGELGIWVKGVVQQLSPLP